MAHHNHLSRILNLREGSFHIANQIHWYVNKILSKPITKENLYKGINSVAKGRFPKLDGFIIKFYTFFWDLIGEDYFDMTNEAIEKCKLLNMVIKGLVILIYKAKDEEKLSKYRFIMLFNVAYKVFAKVL